MFMSTEEASANIYCGVTLSHMFCNVSRNCEYTVINNDTLQRNTKKLINGSWSFQSQMYPEISWFKCSKLIFLTLDHLYLSPFLPAGFQGKSFQLDICDLQEKISCPPQREIKICLVMVHTNCNSALAWFLGHAIFFVWSENKIPFRFLPNSFQKEQKQR